MLKKRTVFLLLMIASLYGGTQTRASEQMEIVDRFLSRVRPHVISSLNPCLNQVKNKYQAVLDRITQRNELFFGPAPHICILDYDSGAEESPASAEPYTNTIRISPDSLNAISAASANYVTAILSHELAHLILGHSKVRRSDGRKYNLGLISVENESSVKKAVHFFNQSNQIKAYYNSDYWESTKDFLRTVRNPSGFNDLNPDYQKVTNLHYNLEEDPSFQTQVIPAIKRALKRYGFSNETITNTIALKEVEADILGAYLYLRAGGSREDYAGLWNYLHLTDTQVSCPSIAEDRVVFEDRSIDPFHPTPCWRYLYSKKILNLH